MSLATVFEENHRKMNDTPQKSGKKHSDSTFANYQSSIQWGDSSASTPIKKSELSKKKAGSPKQYCNISTITNTFATITSTAGLPTDPNSGCNKKPSALRGVYKAEFDAEQKRLKTEENQKKKFDAQKKWFDETSNFLKQKNEEETQLSHNQPHYFDVKKKISPSRRRQEDVPLTPSSASSSAASTTKAPTQKPEITEKPTLKTVTSASTNDLMKLARGHNPLPNNSIFSHTATVFAQGLPGPYVYKNRPQTQHDEDHTVAAPSGTNRHLLWKTKEIQTFKIG